MDFITLLKNHYSRKKGPASFKLPKEIEDSISKTDADGQKLTTSESTIQSRYSKKYLGKAPGISVYTLIANFVAVNAKNIGLNEYEGHSLYDLINGNKTDINIDMVTGDNHSLSQLNFVILDSIDVDYVPSIKDIKEVARDLYSVKPVSDYPGIIRPRSVINSNLRSEASYGFFYHYCYRKIPKVPLLKR